MENISYYLNTKSCQVDIQEFTPAEDLEVNKQNYDYAPRIAKNLRKISPETEKSKLINQRRIMASVGKKASKDKICNSNTKNKHSSPFLKHSNQTELSDFLSTQGYITRLQKKEQIFPASIISLPKIVEKKESAPICRRGKLGPLVHSPYRELPLENPCHSAIRKYSYFHIRNFSVHHNNIDN